MIDQLKEIIAYTHALEFLNLVKVTGTTTSTELTAIDPEKSVVLYSKFNDVIPEFEGIFGLHDLKRLNVILNIPEYRENAFVQITKQVREGVDTPVGISFANAARDFRNDYRFMSQEIIEIQMPSKTRKPITWDLSFEPAQLSISRLKYQAAAASTAELNFQTIMKGNDLIFSIGDHSTHTGDFVFAHNVKGKLKSTKDWNLKHVLDILNLAGDKKVDISDHGAMQITVNSGLAEHSYTVLAVCK
jgi:hypothetical protein